MNKLKELKGRDVLKIERLDAHIKYDVEDDHKMSGQKYTNYAIKNKVISINDKSKFHKDFDNSIVYSLDVEESDVDGRIVWSFAGYTTTTAEIVMAKTEAELTSFSAVVNVTALADADVDALKED